MGRPVGAINNSFKNIKMAQSSSNEKQTDIKDKQKYLNQITGYKEKSNFVDAKTHNKMGKDEFLKLLTFQLQNQDPVNPMDQKQFASDLAQFSQLEQLSNMNKGFEKLNSNGPDEKKFFAASFLGKEILTSGSSIQLNNDTTNLDIPFSLPQNAKSAIVRIYDSKNQLIQQIERDNLFKGQNVVSWDGNQSDGGRASSDIYRYEIHAWDDQNQFFRGETKATGIVTGVYFDENGETILKVDGKKRVNLRDVDAFNVPSHNKADANAVQGKNVNKQAMNIYENQANGKR
ncbi:MAG: hypothetical protein H6622_00820 [Halobacteriovoraceae bacterium]|nr:hypothetical protein [Halobacteriovoraceae bacterium]